jgi:hypothetical protein
MRRFGKQMSDHIDNEANYFTGSLYRAAVMHLAEPALARPSSTPETAKLFPTGTAIRQSASVPINTFNTEKMEFTTEVNKATWKKEGPVLTRMGMYHPLEISHIRFPCDRLSEVLDFLEEVFRALSLRTIYHDAPLAASCESLEQLELRVSLWKDRKDSAEAVLEVQRVLGDSVLFCMYAKRILNAVRGEKLELAVSRHVPMPALRKAEYTLQYAMRETNISEDPVVSALEIAHNLICADRHDARILGLESLCIMTDPGKTGLETAERVARCVLLGEAASQTNHAVLAPIQERVLTLTVLGAWPGTSIREAGKRDAYLALVTVANGLRLLAPADLTNALNECVRLTGVELVEVLLAKVEEAAHHPHSAYFALEALEALCALPAVRGHIQVPLVKHAQGVGSSSHAALASVSSRVLVALEA